MRRLTTVLAAASIFVLVLATPAFALHCTNVNKKAGAGTVTEEDIKLAGNSGNFVAPGAFVSGAEFGLETDFFIRGPELRDFDEAELGINIQGFGSLPEGPHANGGENGVVGFEFPEP